MKIIKYPDKRKIYELIIVSLALLLLLILGFGESIKTYSRYRREGANSLVESITNSVESLLSAGLPLKQFVGFENLTDPIMDVDNSIKRIDITDIYGNVIFYNELVKVNNIWNFSLSKFQDNLILYQCKDNKQYYRIEIPLDNKFESVGYLRVYLSKDIINQPVNYKFKRLIIVFFLILLFYYLLSSYLDKNSSKKHKQNLTLLFAISFMLMSMALIYVLFNIYYEGIKQKSYNLVNSINKRIVVIERMDLDISDISKIDEVFDNYILFNNEISSISLDMNNKRVFYSVNKLINKTDILNESSNIKYSMLNNKVNITLRVFKKAIYGKLWSGIKNFLVLFIASIIMAVLFLNLSFSLSKTKNPVIPDEKAYLLELIKPIFFVGVFIEALNSSFLPQYFKEIASKSNLGDNFTSLLFTVFFISYGFILVPATKLCNRKGIKFGLLLALLLTGLASLGMAIFNNYYLVFILRLLIGLAQGLLLIAVQLYILKVNPEKQKTKALAIIVIQYYAGRVAGTAIGALAFSYINTSGIFYLGAFVSILIISFTYKLLPKDDLPKMLDYQIKPQKKYSFNNKMRIIFKDFEFLKTAFIGINAKLIMIGVIGFALPIVMEHLHFLREDIGQVLMLYSAGVLISTSYSSHLADLSGNVRKLLFQGNLCSGIGLIIMGMSGLAFIPLKSYLLFMFLGTFLLGLSHGFVATPVSANILKTKTARLIGKGEALSLLRLSERFGNILGPLLLGFLLAFSNSSLVFIYIGLLIFIIGLFFFWGSNSRIAKSAIIIIIITFIFVKPISANNYIDWFKFSNKLSKHWTIVQNPSNNFQFDILPKLKSDILPNKKIFVLIAKESSAYPVAMESVLLFFEDKKVYPNFTIVNYNEDNILAANAMNKALHEKYALIFAMGSMSIDYLYHNLKHSKLPVVSICAKDPVLMGYIKDYNSGSSNNFAYTSINIPVEHQMVYLNKFMKKITNLAILYEKNNKSAYQTQAKPLKDYAEKQGIKVYDVIVENPEKASQELAIIVPYTLKKMQSNDKTLTQSIFLVTGSTSIFSNLDVVNKYSGNAPVFGVAPNMVNSGENSVAVAIGVGFEVNAQLASIYALKILNQEIRPGNLKVGVVSPPDIAINFERVNAIKMKIPFSELETAGFIYNKNGKLVKSQGILINN